MTRFGVISPLRQNFNRPWQVLKGPLSIFQNFEHTLAITLCYWAKFQCCKWPNIERVIKSSGHTGSQLYLQKAFSTFMS